LYLYRTPAGPLIGLDPSFVHAFALNLETFDRGPYVPMPSPGLQGAEPRFEGRPFRNSPEIFLQISSDLATRLPKPDDDRPLDGFSPSEEGLRWYLTHSRCEPPRDFFSFTFQQKGKGKKAPRGRLLEVFSCLGTTAVSVSTAARPNFCLTQESQWSRDEDGNMDLLRAIFFSKKGPPDWKDLAVPFGEVLSLLSLALYETWGVGFLRVQEDRHQGWMEASREFKSPESVASWLEPAFHAKESGSVRTLRQIWFRDRFGLDREDPVLYARWFRPYKKSDWYLEINYRQRPGEASVPTPVKDLARKANGGS
jgi:hypothetical protein